MTQTLEDVANNISYKDENRPQGIVPPGQVSQTVRALEMTRNKSGQKLIEEAAEVWEASLNDRREDVISEMSQLWWWCMVLLHKHGIDHHEVIESI